jgi:dephospho-CoA kinase
VLNIALTGNIASGKSEVARMFAELGAVIIDADELAREAVRPRTPAMTAIAARWGTGVLRPDGTLDREALRAIVFTSESARHELNRMVHPEVGRLREGLIEEARARGIDVVVSDIPLLFEAGLESGFDRIVLVDAPEPVRLARLMERRGLPEDEARRMIAAQMPSSGKRARADVVIDNDGSIDALRSEVARTWKSLTEAA